MAFTNQNKNMTGNCLTNLSKFDFFKHCMKIEINGAKNHFLHISGITQDFLEGKEIEKPEGDWGFTSATKRCLRLAIWRFYQMFDRSRYATFLFTNPTPNVITPVVWAKFRQVHNEWTVEHKFHIVILSAAANQRYLEDRHRGHLKRQEREKVQMLRMGGGDLDKGKKAFVERMKVQKMAKLNTVNDVSIQVEEAFAKWLSTPEAAVYANPLVDSAPKQFKRGETYGIHRKLVTINLKVNGTAGVVDALRKLAAHPAADTLTIDAVLAWDEKEAFNNPSSHIYAGNTVLALGSTSRVIQNDKKRVLGMVIVGGYAYIVTPETSNSYRLFPKQFKKLESRNKKVSGIVSVMYNVNKSLSRIKVTRTHMGTKTVMNIDIMSSGTATVDPLKIFESHVIRDLKEQTNTALAAKRKEKTARDNAARRSGQSTKRNKVAWNDEGKHNKHNKSDEYSRIDKAIRDGHVTIRDPKTDTMDQIVKLCDMFEKGLLNEPQFEAAKEKVLS